MNLRYRTDLASEAVCAEKIEGCFEGLSYSESTLHGLSLEEVHIKSEAAAARLRKPIGKYYTLHLPGSRERRDESFDSACRAIGELILRCLEGVKKGSCLVAALGNPDITPDAIGPLTASSVLVTRHLKENSSPLFESFSSVALCRTGVMGTTGLESALQVKALCEGLKPDFVIAIDALAGSDAAGLCSSVQICSTGIAPGSGVKNDRLPLDEDVLGCPVVAVGVPTVIDAGSLTGDKALSDMFVTPRGIDSMVRCCSRLIAYGINLALHPGLTVGDIDMLLG